VEGRQELLFDQDVEIVMMGSKKRKSPSQLSENFFSSDSQEFVALPSCSNQDVSDPNLFKNIIQSIRLLHISSKLF
jgi:hypothetical protein